MRIAWRAAVLAVGAAVGVSVGGPLLLWLMSHGSWAGEITLDIWSGIAGAIAAVVGGDTEIWLDVIARVLGTMLGVAATAHWIGCPSHQVTGAAIGAFAGYGSWLLVVVAVGLLRAPPILVSLLNETSETGFVVAMMVVTMLGAAIGSVGAALQPTRQRIAE